LRHVRRRAYTDTIILLLDRGGSVPKKRVLLVDDDPDIVESFSMLLQSKYDVQAAENGADALALLTERAFDVILLDLMMPVMDGATLKRTLDARGVATPIIILSAGANVADHAQGLGIDAFLVKPIDIDDLEAMIERVTGGGTSGGGAVPTGGSSRAPWRRGPYQSSLPGRHRVGAEAFSLGAY
jgi:DNA-binding response OmpR family regulator